MNDIKNCPICGHGVFKHYLDVKDNMITKEDFKIVECENCTFRFTNPIPELSDIGKYYKSEDYVSHSSTDKGIMNKLYQKVRKKTLKEKKQLLDKVAHPKSILDIGCGTGHFLKYLSEFDYQLLGLEPDDDARAFAKESGVNAEPLDQLHHLENEKWDAITMWHVLEHVYDLQKDFKKFVDLLVPGGYLFVAVPNHNSLDAKIYGDKWAAYDVPRHLYHFRENDIELLAKNYNLSLEEVVPMRFDSYYVSMLSESYIDGSKVKAFFNGRKSNKKADIHGYSSQIYVLKKN
jgi:2-polyprenyl-3-methyl-5-hydroxy-6-metoxy-1,4-benzoquinol methylase